MNLNNKDEAWKAYQDSFSNHYDSDVMTGSNLQGSVIRAGRKLCENYFNKNLIFDKVIEIGAGTGEHINFIRHQFSEYFFTDHNYQALEVAKKKNIHLFNSSKLHFHVLDGKNLNFPDNYFDRLISTHVLEHIYMPHDAIKEWYRVIKPGGFMSILIPTDPGLLWRFGRTLGPRRRSIRAGLPYDYLIARDHVNPCHNLIAILRYYFPNLQEAWWPTFIPHFDFNLFYIVHIKK